MEFVPANWSALVRTARERRFAAWTALVVGAWAVVGLAVLLVVARHADFRVSPHPPAIGWSTANHYPKYREQILFLVAVVGVPATAVVGWLAWLTTAGRLAPRGGAPLARLLRQSALAQLPWLLLAPGLWRLDGNLWRCFLLAAGIQLGWLLVCAWWNRVRCRRATEAIASTLPQEPRSTTSADDRSERSAEPESLSPSPEIRPRYLGTLGMTDGNPVARQLRRVGRILYVVVFHLAVPALLYRLQYQPAIDGGIDLFHEAECLVPMHELNHGGVPYRDVYLQHGLLHNAWLPWLGGKLFGPTLAGMRTMNRLVEPLGVVGLYYLGLVLYRGRALTALALAAILCGHWPHIPARGVFGFLALAVVCADINRRSGSPARSRAMPFIAGLVGALAFWHSVEVGLYTLGAIGVFYALVARLECGTDGASPVRRWGWRSLGWWALGGAAGFWLVGWYFLAHGALGDVARNVFVQCVYQNQVWGLPTPSFFGFAEPLLRGTQKVEWPKTFIGGPILYYYLPLLVTAAGVWLGYRFVRDRLLNSPTALRLLLLTLAGACFYRTVLGRSDYWHLYYGTIFALLLGLFVADGLIGSGLTGLGRRGATWRARTLAVVPLAAGLGAAWAVGSYAVAAWQPAKGLTERWRALAKPPAHTSAKAEALPGAGVVSVPAEQVQMLTRLRAALEAAVPAGQPVFDFTNQAGQLCFADRRSASRYFHIVYAATPREEREVVSMLERTQPVAVLRTGAWTEGFDGVPQSQRTPLIAAYLKEHYELRPVADTPYVLGVPRAAW